MVVSSSLLSLSQLSQLSLSLITYNMDAGNLKMGPSNASLKPKRRIVPTKMYLGYLEKIEEAKTAKNGELYNVVRFQVSFLYLGSVHSVQSLTLVSESHVGV